MTLIGKFGVVGAPERQLDLLDNNTEYLVLGNATAIREFHMEWTFELPILDKAMRGKHRILIDGAGIGLEYDYSFLNEIRGVEFDVDILGTDARLKIVTSGLGENPKMVYRLESLSRAS
jgi:hypothetical protein